MIWNILIVLGVLLIAVNQILLFKVSWISAILLVLAGFIVKGKMDIFVREYEDRKIQKMIDAIDSPEPKDKNSCSGCSSCQ